MTRWPNDSMAEAGSIYGRPKDRLRSSLSEANASGWRIAHGVAEHAQDRKPPLWGVSEEARRRSPGRQ